jgi:hypothetical protein
MATSTTAPTEVEIKTAHPSPFNGSYAQYRPWIREVKIKILADKLQDSQDKILCTLQYMKMGQALEFRDSFLDEALADPDLPNFGTWTDFLTRLDQRFHDPHFQSRAREKVKDFTQRNLGVEEYITRLEELFRRAELTDEAKKVHIIKKNIKADTLCIVYNLDALPVTYAAWKTKVIKIGKLQEELNQIQKNRNRRETLPSPATPSTTSSKPASTMSKYNISPVAPEKKPMPKGYGTPMDIDCIKNASCFNCSSKGHFRGNCPEPKKTINVQEMWEQLEDEERENMYIEVNTMRLMMDADEDF